MNTRNRIRSSVSGLCITLLVLIVVVTGCQTSEEKHKPSFSTLTNTTSIEALRLREGDVIRIQFPGAPNLDTRETIRRDGKITVLGGEVTAAGKTLQELQKELLDIYSPQLVTKALTVTLDASSFPVYLTGAVQRNGRINFDRPVTALEAVMEAGVDLSRANLKAVRVTRSTNGRTEVFTLNLDKVLKGKSGDAAPFYLKASDILYVPEKFQWY